MNINRVFRIYDSEDNPVSLNRVDEIACRVWGCEQDDRHYATPTEGNYFQNWFEVIGGAITECSHREPRWAHISGLLFATAGYPEYFTSPDVDQATKEFKRVRELYADHFKLIRHLDRQGYYVKVFDKE